MKQQRNSRQRQLILDAVMARRDHPTADQISFSYFTSFPVFC